MTPAEHIELAEKMLAKAQDLVGTAASGAYRTDVLIAANTHATLAVAKLAQEGAR